MNKIIIFLLIIGTLGACKKNPEKEMQNANEAVAEAIPKDTITLTPTPTFTNEAAQKYVTAYDAFLVEYKDAAMADDKIKLQELGNEMVKLSTQGVDALKNLSGEEANKLTDYMRSRADRFSRISTGNY